MITSKRKINRFVLLCAFTYFISYITRINYGAVISEIVTSTGLSKSALSVALTGSFITYGAGQLVSGYFGDHIQPKFLLALGMLVSSLMNICIPFCSSPALIAVIWCINGFAQAFMWPPLVKLMLYLLTEEDYAKGIVKVSWGSSAGTLFVYLVAPVMIMAAGWKGVFWISAAMGLIGMLIWLRGCPDITLTKVHQEKVETQIPRTRLFTPLLVLSMLAIVMQGMLRDGVTTWMPSFISETYHLSNEISILTGVVLPVFSVLCYSAAGTLYRKKLPNLLVCALLFFGIGLGAALLLYGCSGSNAALAVLLSAVLTGCMHGVNLLLNCLLPPYLSDPEHRSVVAGLLNSCTYVGSAISAYAIPLATEGAGWSVTILLWAAAAAVGTVICLVCIPLWKNHKK